MMYITQSAELLPSGDKSSSGRLQSGANYVSDTVVPRSKRPAKPPSAQGERALHLDHHCRGGGGTGLSRQRRSGSGGHLGRAPGHPLRPPTTTSLGGVIKRVRLAYPVAESKQA